ncbi:hypothetical protein Ancab_014780 [Ancistrocladus abbreviatus]
MFRLIGDVQLRIGEKKTEVAELDDRVLYGRGMAAATEKKGSTSDTPLDEKATEERRAGNQTGLREISLKGVCCPHGLKGNTQWAVGRLRTGLNAPKPT